MRGKPSAAPDGVCDIPATCSRSTSSQNAISTLTNTRNGLSLIGIIARIMLGGTSMSVDVVWETGYPEGVDNVRVLSEKYGKLPVNPT